MEKCFCALSDQLDWTNLEGYDHPVDMSKPLPLQEKEGRRIIPIEVFFNNNLDYLKGDKAKRTYSSSITKTPTASSWDKALETTKTIVLQSHDQQEVQSCCLFKNENPECLALRMFTRGIVLQSRVKDVQLGVQTYQRKLNLIIPQRSCLGMFAKELYTLNYDPQGAQELQTWIQPQSDMPRRELTDKDQKHTGYILRKMDDQLLRRRIMRSLKVLVGGRNTETDRRLLQRTV
ncbi:hypothetical protein Tco_0264744 [Tanacetum coccineum]